MLKQLQPEMTSVVCHFGFGFESHNTNMFAHLVKVVFFCIFQALEFFLKAEEGKTQRTNKVTEATT